MENSRKKDLSSHENTPKTLFYDFPDVAYWKRNEEPKKEQDSADCNIYDNDSVKRTQRRAQTDQQIPHIYEDIDPKAPPRIAPVSGVLGFTKAKNMIKPMAFKPVISNFDHTSSPLKEKKNIFTCSPFSSSECEEHSVSVTSQANSCALTPKSILSQSYCSSSQNSFLIEDDHIYSDITFHGLQFKSDIFTFTPRNECNIVLGEYCAQTPSPSDSGIAELEAILREKDSEINYLRETLEQNEQVIFKVYEEKEQGWCKEISKVRHHYEQQIRNYQRKLAKAEQTSVTQSEAFLIEKHKFETQINELKKRNYELEKQNCTLEKQVSVCERQLEETQWSEHQKNKHLTQLLSHLNQTNNDHDFRDTQINSLKVQLKETKGFAENKNIQTVQLIEKLHSLKSKLLENKRKEESCLQSLQKQLNDTVAQVNEKCALVEQLKLQNDSFRSNLNNLQKQLMNCEQKFSKEKYQWMQEKQRVISYHKHLQSRYFYIYKQQKASQQQIKCLTAELQNICVNETCC